MAQGILKLTIILNPALIVLQPLPRGLCLWRGESARRRLPAM